MAGGALTRRAAAPTGVPARSGGSRACLAWGGRVGGPLPTRTDQRCPGGAPRPPEPGGSQPERRTGRADRPDTMTRAISRASTLTSPRDPSEVQGRLHRRRAQRPAAQDPRPSSSWRHRRSCPKLLQPPVEPAGQGPHRGGGTRQMTPAPNTRFGRFRATTSAQIRDQRWPRSSAVELSGGGPQLLWWLGVGSGTVQVTVYRARRPVTRLQGADGLRR